MGTSAAEAASKKWGLVPIPPRPSPRAGMGSGRRLTWAVGQEGRHPCRLRSGPWPPVPRLCLAFTLCAFPSKLPMTGTPVVVVVGLLLSFPAAFGAPGEGLACSRCSVTAGHRPAQIRCLRSLAGRALRTCCGAQGGRPSRASQGRT